MEVDEDFWGGLRLMERMIGYDRAIVIDAICSGAPPGTIHHLTPGSIRTQRSSSAHDVNLPTALLFGRKAGICLPADEDILLVGIEAEDVINFSERLHAGGQAALPEAVRSVLAALGESWVDYSCGARFQRAWHVGNVPHVFVSQSLRPDHHREIALHDPSKYSGRISIGRSLYVQ